MSSQFHRAETQRARLVLNRETLRTLQLNPRGSHACTDTGQGCPTTTKDLHEPY